MDGRRNSKEDESQSHNPFFQTPLPPANSPYLQTHVPSNTSAYQQPPPGWNQYMYQSPPPGWFPQGMQQPQPGVMYVPAQPHGAMYPAMAQPSVGDEDDVEVLASPPADSVPSSDRRSRTKLANFNPTEDIALVKAWLEISCDPVIGNGQRQEGFWKRVVERYDFRRGDYPERSCRSLSSRWGTIKAQCGKFAGCFAEASRLNPSGKSDADLTTLAAANFADLDGHSFQFMHCWELMKDEPKWRDPPDHNGEGFGDDGSDDSNRVANEGDKVAGKRPMGRDRAKANSKRSKSTSGDGEYATRLQDLSIQKISIMQEDLARKGERFQHLANRDEQRFQQLQNHNQSVLDIEQEKVKIMCEQHEREEKREDERILSINLDSCSPALRSYYEVWQEEIMDKIAVRRQRRNRP